MSPLQVWLVILPLGLDTLGVSLSLGIKSVLRFPAGEQEQSPFFPYWQRSAILFSLAEMLMPAIGLLVGFAVSSLLSIVMHYVGALLLIGLGAWELWQEGREYLRKRRQQNEHTTDPHRSHSRGGGGEDEERGPLRSPSESKNQERFLWKRQLLLALSVSLDELAVGFSLGSIASGKTISPIALCLLIGLQGFLFTIIGLSLGRALRARLKPLQEGSELLGALLLIGLGVWLLVS